MARQPEHRGGGQAGGTSAPVPPPVAHRVGWGFISLYALAYIGTILLFLAPLLVTLALKINALVGTERAPDNLALVTGIGALWPCSPTRSSAGSATAPPHGYGMRRPWMIIGLAGGSLGILVVAVAPNIAVVLVGWCIAQVFFNALLAALVAVLPDQVPTAQRGRSPGSWVSACPSPRSAAPSSSSCSPATSWPCSWPPARSAGSSSCFSRPR